MTTQSEKPARVHYFTSSVCHWCADDDRAECERQQREADEEDQRKGGITSNGYNVWRVPGPCLTTFYKINHYSPQIEGAEFLEFVPYVDEKELPPKHLRRPRSAKR